MKRTHIVGLATSAALLSGGVSLAQAQTQEVKIGFLATFTGPSADVGRDQFDAFTLAIEELGGKLGGKPVKVFKEDDQSRPELGLVAARKLLDKDRVDVMVGLTFANVLTALGSIINATDVPFIGTVAGPSTFAGKQCRSNLFIMSWQSDAPAEAMGKYMTDQKLMKVSVATPNFLGGRDKIAGFKRFYKGQVVDEVYSSMTQLDFSAELTQMAQPKPNAIFAFYPGAMGVTFLRQHNQAGLTKSLPVYSVQTVESTTLPALGNAAVGSLVAEAWEPSQDNAKSKAFVAAFERRFKRTPSSYAAFTYDAAQLLNVAATEVKGDLSKRRELTAAIKKGQFESVRGPFKFNKNNYPVQNYHVYALEAGAGNGLPVFKQIAKDVLVDHSDAYVGECRS